MKSILTSAVLALCTTTQVSAYNNYTANPLSNYATNSYASMALSQLTKIAQSGDKHAQFFLANRYKLGSGISKDLQAAFKWFKASAEQGAAPAQLNIGQMYATGNGVKKDLTQAQKWLKMAARQGDNRACYNLALINEHNNDYTTAYQWYELAARPEMLSDSVRKLSRTKLMKLTNKLSPQDINRAKDNAHRWLHTQ